MKLAAAPSLPVDDTAQVIKPSHSAASGRLFDVAIPFTDLSYRDSIKTGITKEV